MILNKNSYLHKKFLFFKILERHLYSYKKNFFKANANSFEGVRMISKKEKKIELLPLLEEINFYICLSNVIIVQLWGL